MARSPSKALIAGSGALAALLAVWAAAFHLRPAQWFDQAVLSGFISVREAFGGDLGAFAIWTNRIAHLGDPFWFALIGAGLVATAALRGRLRLAGAIAVVLAAANVTTQLLKPALASPRPHVWLGDLPIGDGSWPSGHATATMSLALCGVLAVAPRFRPIAATIGAAFSIAVTFSLLAHEWHYPSDVLGGFLVATFWTSMGIAAVWASERRWPQPLAARARERVPAARTFGPPLAGASAAVGGVVALVVLRPFASLSFAEEHTAFVLGAVLLAGFGLALAAGLAALLRR